MFQFNLLIKVRKVIMIFSRSPRLPNIVIDFVARMDIYLQTCRFVWLPQQNLSSVFLTKAVMKFYKSVLTETQVCRSDSDCNSQERKFCFKPSATSATGLNTHQLDQSLIRNKRCNVLIHSKQL